MKKFVIRIGIFLSPAFLLTAIWHMSQQPLQAAESSPATAAPCLLVHGADSMESHAR